MQLVILSRGRTLYSTRRLAEAARRRQHSVRILDPFLCTIHVEAHRSHVLYNGEPLPHIDCVIPRTATNSADMVAGLLDCFQHAGAVCMNDAQSVLRSRDKFRSLQSMALDDIPVPRTIMVRHSSQIEPALQSLNGPPVIIKLRQGTQGVGVVKADSFSSAHSMIQALWSMEQSVLLQEFIAESGGSDTRAFIVNGQVVGAMERRSISGDFRSNLHLGGEAQRVKLDNHTRDIALRAAEHFGLLVTGVDMLISEHGPLVTEVNPSPGLEGIEGITGFDIAKTIVKCAEELVAQRATEL